MKYLIILIAVATTFISFAQEESEATYHGVSKVESSSEPNQTYEIADFPDVEPAYPGGPTALNDFLSHTIEYPESSLEIQEQGRVYVSFVVLKDGSIDNIKIERGISEALDNEAIRVVEAMPKWIPGELFGEPANTRKMLPIRFFIH